MGLYLSGIEYFQVEMGSDTISNTSNINRLSIQMPSFTSPEAVVQRQLDAYNAKDLDAWLSTYAEDAKQFELGGGLLAQGHVAIRARTANKWVLPQISDPNFLY